jgi:hypothetical protein
VESCKDSQNVEKSPEIPAFGVESCESMRHPAVAFCAVFFAAAAAPLFTPSVLTGCRNGRSGGAPPAISFSCRQHFGLKRPHPQGLKRPIQRQ